MNTGYQITSHSIHGEKSMNIAVGYVRCSTEMQDDSLDQQKDEIQKWASANDFSIIRWHEDEGKSGTSFEKRSAFMDMMKRVETRPDFLYILVYDESRWGRPNNPRENTYWKVHAERHGVKVRIINSSSRNENDIGSFVTEVVESAEASEYSKKLARATLRGSIANAGRGYSSGGTAPYGYIRVAIDKETGERLHPLKHGEWIRSNLEKVCWEIGDPSEVEIVKRIFNMKSSGVGYVMIADTLNKEGVPCPRRGRWRNKDQKWCQGTIRSIIINMAYCGIRVYNKHPQSHLRLGISKQRYINNRENWVIQEDAHPAIISEELFNKANTTNRHKFGTGSAQTVKSEYLLSGLIKCNYCGFNFSGQRHHKSGIHYYQDSGYINKGKSVCTSYLIRKDRIESFIIKSIKENIIYANLESKLQQIVERQLEAKNKVKHTSTDRIEKALANNKIQMDNLIDAISNGIKVDTVLEKVKQLEAERDRLLREKDNSKENNIQKDDIKVLATRITQEVHNFERVFESASLIEKKHWIRQFVLGIRVDRENNRALCYIMKIPMVSHPAMTAFIPSESSIMVVAGTGLEPVTFGL